MRRLFEEAAIKAITYDQLDSIDYNNKFVFILAHDNSFSFISNDSETLRILCHYKTITFDEKNIYELDDNVTGIQISPETIFLYASAEAAQHIPGIQQVIKTSQWRTQNILLFDESDDPILLLRGCVEGNPNGELSSYVTTLSNYACDGNTIITQQLINYSWHLKNRNQSSIIEFPDQEGRGAIFSIAGVPFHSYNSYTRNDDICEFLGLIKKTDSLTWNINLKANLLYSKGIIDYKNILVAPYNNYIAIPSIAEWRKNGAMCSAITIALRSYINTSLALQLLNPSLRIKRADGTTASHPEILEAQQKLRDYKKNAISKDEHPSYTPPKP